MSIFNFHDNRDLTITLPAQIIFLRFSDDSQTVWQQLVIELVEYCVSIESFKGRANYDRLGSWITAKYPCLKREGTKPWVQIFPICRVLSFVFSCEILPCDVFYLQTSLTTVVSGRVRGQRHKMNKQKENLSEEPPSKKPWTVLDACEVLDDESTAMTPELYAHIQKECKKRSSDINNNRIKQMIRQTYAIRYKLVISFSLFRSKTCLTV